MPIYEYVCTECGEPLEKLQKLADAPLTDCPACGQASLKRKVSAAGFRLSGGGWYETDFKSDNRRNITGGGEAESSSKDSKDAKSDASKGGDSKKSDSAGSGKTSGDSKSASSNSGQTGGGKTSSAGGG